MRPLLVLNKQRPTANDVVQEGASPSPILRGMVNSTELMDFITHSTEETVVQTNHDLSKSRHLHLHSITRVVRRKLQQNTVPLL